MLSYYYLNDESKLSLLCCFSYKIWSKVKGANPSMSVCEVGAAIGRLWRELDDAEKQRYNHAFTDDKVRSFLDRTRFLRILFPCPLGRFMSLLSTSWDFGLCTDLV